MDEREWLNAIEPEPMLDFLGGVRRDEVRERNYMRKLWLFLLACTSRVIHLYDAEERAIMEQAHDISPYAAEIDAAAAADHVAELAVVAPDRQAELAAQADLLREIFGNPFRPLPPLRPSLLAWNDRTVVQLALRIYKQKDFSRESMGVLADALEDAGVTDQEMLGHLRGPGPHARGCFVIDWLLGKDGGR